MSATNSTDDPIVKDSIFNEGEFEGLRISIAYRFIGILRLIWIVILSVALLNYFFFQFSFSSDIPVLIGNVIGLFLIGGLFILMIIYHVNQLRVEIKRSHEIFAKRKFRMLSIILQMLFSIVALWTLVVKTDLTLNFGFIIQLLWAAILITILVVDLEYYIRLRNKSR